MNSILPSSIYPGLCDFASPIYWIFSENVPSLVYFSHIPVIVISLLLGFFVLFKNRHGLSNLALFTLTALYSFYVFLDLIFWASNRGDVITFVWSLQILFEPIIYISAFYLIYTLIAGKDMPFSYKLILTGLYTPVILLIPTRQMLHSFDESSCLSVEGPMATFYTYGIETLIVIWILIFAVYQYKAQANRRAEIFVLTIAILCLLSMLSIGNIISSFTEDWQFAQIGFFTMPIFITFFVYSIVKYKTFQIQIFSTVALVLGLVILNFSLLFVTEIDTYHTVVTVIFILVCIFGYLLIRSVSREINHLRKIEQLIYDIERANIRLRQLDKQKSEFVSIASHQLRSPLTSIAGYSSMLREGNYGPVPSNMLEPLDRIEQSARFMAESIEDYLNVSRIESGNMKYHLADFNLRTEAEHICDDLRASALRKGLVLLFRTKLTSQAIVNADLGKTQQILHNLINNSLKYTQKGTINVVVRDDLKTKKVYVDIVDTGIGMTKETRDSIFQKFERGEEANSVNVKGTGLGLYVAQKMTEAMGGTVTAHSEGADKGSRFTLELPLVM